MESLQTTLVNTVVGILTGLILLGGALLNLYLKKAYDKVKAQTDGINDVNQRNFINKTLDNINNLITKAVCATQLTLVSEIKASADDGKLTKEDGIKIKDEVLNLIKNQLSDEAKAVISTQVNDLDSYIQTEIEIALGKIKGQVGEI